MHLRGAAAQLRGPARARPSRASTWCRASARSSPTRRCRPGGPFWVDDPAFNLEYHVRHSALPVAGLGGAAAQHGGAGLLPAARPHEAALGAVAGPGPDPEALRARHQDPPRARRRRLGGRHRDRAVRRQAGARAGASPTTSGSPAPEPSARAAAGQGRRGAGRARRSALARRARARGRAPARTRCRQVARGGRGARRGRLELRQPGAGRAAQRPDRLAPAVRVGAQPTWRSSSGSRTRSGARSTTSSSPWSAGRCGAGCTARGVRTEGLELRAQVPVSIRADRRARPPRQQDRRGPRPAPGLRRGPGAAARASAAGRWRGSSSRSRRSAPR